MNRKVFDLEFRWMTEEQRFPEIVKWKESDVGLGPYCYTLAKWGNGSEGYSLEFIGSRPLDPQIDKDIFWELIKYGQKICDAVFEIEAFKHYRVTEQL